ncbi:MAG: SHOCT-like domain-containing protein [Armatimonadota bacterium]
MEGCDYPLVKKDCSEIISSGGGGMSEELRRILSMVEQGKITPEEGARLITAINTAAAPERVELRQPVPKLLRIQVEESNGCNVSVNIPVSLANIVSRFIPRNALTFGDQVIDINDVLKAIHEGAEGKILEVKAEDGSRVEISVE